MNLNTNNEYKFLKKSEFKFKQYKLVPVRLNDIENIRKWRNEQMEVLRQNKKLTKNDQERYFKNVIQPTHRQTNPDLILFSMFLNDLHIAYGGVN